MNPPNGSNHGVPLELSTERRAEILRKAGLGSGWVLLSVSEMFQLKRTMDGAAKENERLNKQTAKLMARQIVNAAIVDQTLASARAFLEIVATRDQDPTFRIDALDRIKNIDDAIAVLPKPKPIKTENKKPDES